MAGIPLQALPGRAPAPRPTSGVASFPGGSAVTRIKSAGKAPKALDVTGMQKLLAQHGYQIPVDGVNGPLTQAAAADFRGSRNPDAFNVGHGLAHGQGPTVVPGLSSAPARAGQTVPVNAEPARKGVPVPVVTVGARGGSYSTDSQGRTDTKRDYNPNAPLSGNGPGGASRPGPGKAPVKTAPKPAAKPAAGAGRPGAAPTNPDAAAATSIINAIIAPLIKQITDAETARATQGQGLISGYTNDAMNKLKGIDFQAPFTQAAGGSNAVNTALLHELQGAGAGAQDQVGAQLAGAGQDPTFAAALAARGAADTQGAAGAGLATGDATTNALLSQGAAAGSYGQKLGPITSLAGAQDVSKLLGEVANDQKTQLGDITSKVPGMVQSELGTLTTARTAAEKNRIAQIIAEGYDPNTGQLTPKARAELASATGYDPTTGKPTAKTTISQENANTSQTRATIAQVNSGKVHASVGLSKSNGYLTDTGGNPIYRNGKLVPVAKGTGKALTPNETSTLTTKAEKDAEDLYHGKQHYSGTTLITDSYSVTYQDAIKTLATRYPFLGAKGVLKIVNSLYPAGGTFPDGTPNGRPALNKKQQAASDASVAGQANKGPFAGLGG